MSDCFMKFIKQAFGEMIMRFCLSLDLLNVIYLLQSLFILMKICIVVADVIIALLAPAKVLQ